MLFAELNSLNHIEEKLFLPYRRTVRLGTVKLTTSSDMATTSGATMDEESHDYTQAFPALPEGNTGSNVAPAFGGNWLTKFSVKTSKCTQVGNFCLALPHLNNHYVQKSWLDVKDRVCCFLERHSLEHHVWGKHTKDGGRTIPFVKLKALLCLTFLPSCFLWCLNIVHVYDSVLKLEFD
mgnify:FL=1